MTTATKGGNIRRLLGIAVLFAVIVLVWSLAAGATVAVAPAAITGPVTSVGPTTATVTGTVNPNGLATTWYVDYGTSTSYGTKTANVNAGSGTANTAVSANLTGLTPGATYHYRVVATNSSGTTRGADGIFTTSAAPVAVTGSATSVTVTSATLNGTVDPNSRATSWYFEYGTSTSYGTKTAAKSAGAGTSTVNVSAPVSGLTRGRLYHYRLVATSDAGTSRGADQTFSTSTAPTVVTGSASSIGLTSAKLNGTVTPNGQATSWYFEYGTSTSYGTKTAVKSAGSGTSIVQGRRVADTAAGRRPPTTTGSSPRTRPGRASAATRASARRCRRSRSRARRRPSAATTATAVGSVDPQRAGDDVVHGVRDATGYGSQDVQEKRRLGLGGAERGRAALGPHTGDDLPLQARCDERRGNESRSRRRVHDGRRDAHRAGAPRRLRPWDPARGNRPDQAGRRSRDRVRAEVRRGVVQLDRNGPDRRRRNVALSGEAEDSHVVPGELGEREELARLPSVSGRRSRFAGMQTAASRLALPAPARLRAGSSSSSAGRRQAAGSRSSVYAWAFAPRRSSARRRPAAGSVAPDRDERQPGRPGLPGRLQPDDRLPPQLSRF